MPQTDDRLARRAATGDKRAFAAIFDRYQEPLYRFCLSLLGNAQDAQDALQNTMVKVLRALPGERRQIELKPWLYRIAHNEAIELARRRRPAAPLDPELAGAGAGLAEEAAQRQRLARLIADLDQLPERQRGALVMRELGGLDFEQIGTALGTTAATARQTLYEARLGLRELEAGREMSCLAVTKAISDGDGRVLRRRDLRSHLRGCAECRGFREEISGRERDLAALAPLPAIAAAAMAKGVLGGGGGAGSGGLGAGLGGGAAAKSLAASGLAKGVATVAVVAAVGVTAADRGGLVNLDHGGSGKAAAGAEAAASAPARAAAAAGGTPAVAGAGGAGTTAASRPAANGAGSADPAASGTAGGPAPDSGATGPAAPPISDPGPRPATTTVAEEPDAATHPAASPTLPPASSHGQEAASENRAQGGEGSHGGEPAHGGEHGGPPASPPAQSPSQAPSGPPSETPAPEAAAPEVPPAAEKGLEKAAEHKESPGNH